EPHHSSLAELTVNLSEGGLEGLLAVCGTSHVPGLLLCRVPCAHRLSALRRPVKQGRRSRDRAGISIGEMPLTLRPPTDIRWSDGRKRRQLLFEGSCEGDYRQSNRCSIP